MIEGAGSPAEINLRPTSSTSGSLTHAEAPVLLVADIDRGGAFAHLYGTWALVRAADRATLRGLRPQQVPRRPGAARARARSSSSELTGMPSPACCRCSTTSCPTRTAPPVRAATGPGSAGRVDPLPDCAPTSTSSSCSSRSRTCASSTGPPSSRGRPRRPARVEARRSRPGLASRARLRGAIASLAAGWNAHARHLRRAARCSAAGSTIRPESTATVSGSACFRCRRPSTVTSASSG